MTVDVFEANRRSLERVWAKLYSRVLLEAMTKGDLKLPLQAGITFLVGHDPQKLLPSPEKARPLTLREWAAMYMGSPDFGRFIADRTFLDEEIVFRGKTPRPMVNFRDLYDGVPDVTRWNEADSDPLADIQRWKDQLFGRFQTARRSFWPDFQEPETTTQTMMREREPTFEHKVAIVRRADLDRHTMERLNNDPRVRKIIIDMESGRRLAYDAAVLRAMFGEPHPPEPFSDVLRAVRPELKPEVVSTSSGKRDMDYLKHDRTKSHKRRRR